MKIFKSLVGILLGTVLLGTCRADEPPGVAPVASGQSAPIVVYEGGPYGDGFAGQTGFGYPPDCPPGAYPAYGHGHFQHWHDQSYPGVPRVAGTAGRVAGGVGYVGLQKGYQAGKLGWRMLEGDPGYQGHWNHPYHVPVHGYGGAGGGNWGPHHRTFATYHRPTDLRYPPPQVPAAIVQYPYYTNRGPTDFFMK